MDFRSVVGRATDCVKYATEQAANPPASSHLRSSSFHNHIARALGANMVVMSSNIQPFVQRALGASNLLRRETAKVSFFFSFSKTKDGGYLKGGCKGPKIRDSKGGVDSRNSEFSTCGEA